jgi:hypothetical protein
LFFGIEIIQKNEKMGHFLVVAIVKGINENMAIKIPYVFLSKPFNFKSPRLWTAVYSEQCGRCFIIEIIE